MGVDPGYSNQSFYNRILDQDSERVNARFRSAAADGVPIEQRSASLEEILGHLAAKGPVLVLTNANLLSCVARHKTVNSCTSSRSIIQCCSAPIGFGGKVNYQGHYVLAVGYDRGRGRIVYRNPTYRDRECEISFHNFEEARTSYGTDEDVIFVTNKASAE